MPGSSLRKHPGRIRPVAPASVVAPDEPEMQEDNAYLAVGVHVANGVVEAHGTGLGVLVRGRQVLVPFVNWAGAAVALRRLADQCQARANEETERAAVSEPSSDS